VVRAAASSSNNQVDITTLSNGTYILEAKTSEGRTLRKFSVIH
jgi:hypothetical protein